MDDLARLGYVILIIGFLIFVISLIIFANSTDVTGNINWWGIVSGIALIGTGLILLYASNST